VCKLHNCHDPAAAFRLVEACRAASTGWPIFRKSGRPRPEIGTGARSVTIGRYLVLYRVSSDNVDIVRVIHGAREIAGLLDEE
jgi:toxin ParE1/3/4